MKVRLASIQAYRLNIPLQISSTLQHLVQRGRSRKGLLPLPCSGDFSRCRSTLPEPGPAPTFSRQVGFPHRTERTFKCDMLLWYCCHCMSCKKDPKLTVPSYQFEQF